jgi:hypothetical protein
MRSRLSYAKLPPGQKPLKAGSIMGALKPSNVRVGRKFTLRIRLILAIAGIVLVLLSTLLLISLNRDLPHDQLRYSPPATLFAPPETSP